jgi:hypothetical protein
MFEALGRTVFGGPALDLGVGDAFQAALLGVAKYSKMHAGDRLLVLTTADEAGNFMHNRLDLDRDGNLTVSGNIRAERCAGPVFVDLVDAHSGSMGGYKGANNTCAAGHPGSHLCTVEEVLRSVSASCGAFVAAGGGLANGTRFWIATGPPGFTAPANDCRGWTSAAAGELGAFWEYDANGGRGLLSSCDIAYQLGCCT